ncbi:unnamed protein product [Rhizophagus irregularis]|nr:unnamed protein product [Rhizophagus irregularis]
MLADAKTLGGKKYLEINGDAVGTWGNEQVMEFYAANMFCWWNKPDGRSFYMYFDNLEQWKEAKCWVKKMYPGVLELQKRSSFEPPKLI